MPANGRMDLIQRLKGYSLIACIAQQDACKIPLHK